MKKQTMFKTMGLAAMSLSLLAGCGTPNSTAPSTSSSEEQSLGVVEDDGTLTEGRILVEHVSPTGTHKANVKVGKHFIEEYKILVAKHEGLEDEISFAVQELVHFIKEASGVTLEVVPDSAYIEGEHYISLGHTKAYKNAMIDFGAEKTLGPSGILIKSDKDNVYLLGGEPYGLNHVVYEFLKYEIGLKTYGNHESFFHHKTRLKVHNFNVVDIPDIALRVGGYGHIQNNNTLRSRMKLNTSYDGGKIWMGPDGVPYHNTFAYLPPSRYKAAHPAWYSDDDLQLCFTAHGDKKEQEAMFSTFMDKFLEVVDTHPDCRAITITQQDGAGWCECDACTALKTKYGVDSASVVMFCNRVSDALAEHFKAQNIKRDVDILFFAYCKTEDAPAKKDENGKWQPIDQEVVCRDNVACFYAPIFADYRTSLESSVNVSYSRILEKWQACAKKTYLWIYGTDFHDYLLPMNNFTTIGDNYRWAFENGAVYLYDQGQWNQTIPTGWSLLKAFLQAEMQWDTSLNQSELIEDYFKHWFKDAAKPMKAVFDAWNTHSAYTYMEQGVSVPTFDAKVTPEMFPKAQIDFYLSCFEDAYKAIAPLADTDPATYERVKQRITLESISYRYIDYKLYKSYYSKADREVIWQEFKADIGALGISHLAETVLISTLFGEF